MIIFANDIDPAMRYEGLARKAFDDCGKYGDPFGITAQDKYIRFVPEPTIEGKAMLSKVFTKLVINHKDTEYKDALRELEEKIWEAETQEEIIDIIDKGIKIVQKIEGE